MTVIVGLVSGLGTWLIAPEHTIHIGASSTVFGYASYLISRGFFNRNALELAVGVLVAVVYGSALLGGLVPEDGVSGTATSSALWAASSPPGAWLPAHRRRNGEALRDGLGGVALQVGHLQLHPVAARLSGSSA